MSSTSPSTPHPVEPLVTQPLTAQPLTTDSLTTDSLTALEEARGRLRADPDTLPALLAGAARRIARGPTRPEDPDGLMHPPREDAARAALLTTWWEVAPDPVALRSLYDRGDADERRALLRALPALEATGPDPHATDLLLDALRTNDLRLVAAAMGPYATAHLAQEDWRHGVLKCLFVGVPIAAVDGLPARADGDLRRMVQALAAERRAAGRPLSPDTEHLLATLQPTTTE